MLKDPQEEIMVLKTRVLNLETENKELKEKISVLWTDYEDRQFAERTSYTKMWDDARNSYFDKEEK